MYMGAGLNWRRAMMRERAISELVGGRGWLVLFFGGWGLRVGVGERRDSPLATAQLCQALLPDLAQGDLHLQAIRDGLALGRLELREAAGQQLGKDLAKVAVDLLPRLV
jgi:hypothetical protein